MVPRGATPGSETETRSEGRLWRFFALAFFVSWFIWMPLVAASQGWTDDGPAPFVLYYLGTMGPAVAAVVILLIDHGWAGVRALLGGLILWRVGIKWYLIALLLPAAVRFGSLGLLSLFGWIRSDFSFRPGPELLGLFFFMLLLVPLEEIGWRGYGLPRLQALYGAFCASMILGVLWAMWHLPLVWVRGSYQETSTPFPYMLVFTVTILPISVLFTWIYNSTKGSLLIASLFHAAINVTESVLVIREDDGLLLLLASAVVNSILAAVCIGWWNRTYDPTGR